MLLPNGPVGLDPAMPPTAVDGPTALTAIRMLFISIRFFLLSLKNTNKRIAVSSVSGVSTHGRRCIVNASQRTRSRSAPKVIAMASQQQKH
jgi:hypothetical protein